MKNAAYGLPEYTGELRNHMIHVPKCISRCSGISIFGRVIKSIVFTTDVAIIRNINADAVIAVYPFTPQPVITQSLIMAADVPVFCGVGGGTTTGSRVAHLASHAEFQGAIGVVVNAPTSNETIREMRRVIDIPIVVTVVSEYEDISLRLEAGANILNVSAAADTPALVRELHGRYPDATIIATGGPTEEMILKTIEAGANAITWTPPTVGELFKSMMTRYRHEISGARELLETQPEYI
ncbi:MAG: hydrolase [Oscillospiraceae bacterium]|jgi:2-keto-3-deoxy-6-phosphogluconate aldolase|nr:hydrolase [Oscillospiraceae bacterium]